jgi:hypothetical protein
VPWPPAELSCSEAPVETARMFGCPLRQPFMGQLRTGTDRGNPTVLLKQSIVMAQVGVDAM